MEKCVKISDFLKNKKDENGSGRLDNLLKTDGRELANCLMDFLSIAFVDIADGAICEECHRQTKNLEIYVTIKKKGQ